MSHDSHKRLPANITTLDGRLLLGWRIAILPYLQEGLPLCMQFNLKQPWDHPSNLKLLPQMPKVFAQEWKKPKELFSTYFQVFAGPGTAFEGGPGAGQAQDHSAAARRRQRPPDPGPLSLVGDHPGAGFRRRQREPGSRRAGRDRDDR